MSEMSFSKRLFGHFITITKHKLLVGKLCFKCGLYKQGILHDFSKYSPTEFWRSVKYYQGYRSPINKEKEENGASLVWLHHKGRNKHHWDYWIDLKLNGEGLEALPMPFNYLIESACDKIAASKIYKKKEYNDSAPYEFFYNGGEKRYMHQKTSKQMEHLLLYLKENGEEKTLAYYKDLYNSWKKNKIEPI